MTDHLTALPRTLPAGEIVAVDVDEAAYWTDYAATHHEWVKGVVIKMSPVRLIHEQLVAYLRDLLRAYGSVQDIAGTVVGDPYIMRLPESNRQPDLQVILGDNQANLTDTYMDGPADLCIEVVSPGSVATDYGEKLAEYEAGGVREYWIIDPERRRAQFNRLDAAGLYQIPPLVDDTAYQTPYLPGFRLPLATLWQSPLPDFGAVWQMAQAMRDDPPAG
jgi:Uma2 family endonuclease